MTITDLQTRVLKRVKEGEMVDMYLDEKQRSVLVKAIYPHHILLEYEVAGFFNRGTIRRCLTWFDMAIKLGAIKRHKGG